MKKKEGMDYCPPSDNCGSCGEYVNDRNCSHDFKKISDRLQLRSTPISQNSEENANKMIQVSNYRIIFKDNKIKEFPKILRHILAKSIYFMIIGKINPRYSNNEQITRFIITNINEENLSRNWIKEMEQEQVLSLLRIKLYDINFEGVFFQYLVVLTEIVRRLIKVHKNFNNLNYTDFNKKLIDDGFSFNLKEDSQKDIIKFIIDYFNENIKDFNIKTDKRISVFDDGKYRCCIKCGKKKPYKDFRVDNRDNNISGTCKDCNAKKTALDRYRNKLDAISKIYGGKYENGECFLCDVDISKLPCLTFHHLDPTVKTTEWNNLRSKTTIKEIIDKLESEDVGVVCQNCQRLLHAEVFNRYSEIILDSNIYNYSMKEIEAKTLKKQKLLKECRSKSPYVKSWIKKRIVIEFLYQGKCAGCKEITVFNNLPCLAFHHTDHEIEEKLRWKNIKHLNIREIIQMLLQEKCIALCANCHALVKSSRFSKHSIELLGKVKGLKARTEIEKIKNNIQNFEMKTNETLIPIMREFY